MNFNVTALAEQFSFDAKKPEISAEESEAQLMHMTQTVSDISNAQYGDLDKQDGYNCPKCRNKGYIWHTIIKSNGMIDNTMRKCPCMEKRQGYERTRLSGLLEDYTLDNFDPRDDWQRNMSKLAYNYLSTKAWEDGHWFFIGGTVGSGKTHLVNGMAREIVSYKNVVMMPWVRDSRELKSLVNDDSYLWKIRRLTSCDILFIDDFFHGNITEGDKRLAYDIINQRYTDKKPILFTSERTINEIAGIDEAVGSRIYERCKNFFMKIDRDPYKNQRLR